MNKDPEPRIGIYIKSRQTGGYLYQLQQIAQQLREDKKCLMFCLKSTMMDRYISDLKSMFEIDAHYVKPVVSELSSRGHMKYKYLSEEYDVFLSAGEMEKQEYVDTSLYIILIKES